VLLVDDDPFVLQAMNLLLEQSGVFETVCAAGYPGALARMAEVDRLDVIVADVVLAGTATGIDLSLLAIARFPRLAVVIITGDLHDHSHEVPNRGVYLRKPFGGDELRAALAEAITSLPTT
jgi:CheY-like chemotaxis protein